MFDLTLPFLPFLSSSSEAGLLVTVGFPPPSTTFSTFSVVTLGDSVPPILKLPLFN